MCSKQIKEICYGTFNTNMLQQTLMSYICINVLQCPLINCKITLISSSIKPHTIYMKREMTTDLNHVRNSIYKREMTTDLSHVQNLIDNTD